MAADNTGYFVFSLDTELATGFFDLDAERAALFSPDGSRERWSIHSLLDLMDEFDIRATWAITGHIFYRECEKCPVCPIQEWKGIYKSFDEAYGTNNPLWYGADVVEEIQRRGHHEIGFHGYTHRVFTPATMSAQEAEFEITEWKRVASRIGIEGKSVIFPRDKIGYLDLFARHGFKCYRSEAHLSIWIRNRFFGSYLKTLDHILGITTPPLYTLDELPRTADGMIDITESMHLKGFNWNVEKILDSANLHRLRLRRAVRGIHKAAEQRKVIHLWAHPWEFQTEKDMDKMRYIFEAVAEEQTAGRLQSTTMSALAEKAARSS